MKITKCGDYQTRDGEKLRVVCVDAPGKFSVIGYWVCDKGANVPVVLRRDGKYYDTDRLHDLDIIGPWADFKRSFNRNKKAMGEDPEEWLGWKNDPDNPEYQERRNIAMGLLDKAIKGELPNQQREEG